MRAQVSLEFILAVLVALAAVGAVAVAGESMAQMQAESSARHQLDSIGTGLASAISLSAIFNDADEASVSFTVPKILVLGKSAPEECDIQIAGSSLSLKYTGFAEEIEVVKPFVNPQQIRAPNRFKCGETITLERV